jgi:Ig-like domain from next to BRCA1 gene
MNKKFTIFTLALLILPMILLGCGSKEAAAPTTNPDLIYTAAAQTADARLTQIFQSTPSVTPVTPSPTVNATQTAAAQTAAAMLTQATGLTPSSTMQATATQGAPAPTGDKAAFVADVTIPDGTVIAPGAAFKKTWRLQNAGTTTWTASYSLAFISGEQMGTITSVPISQSVAPGAQIDISVDMVAPNNTGSYQGYWKMKNASGQFFNDSVYVLIKVGSGGTQPSITNTPGPSPTATSTGIPSNPITNLSMSVDQATYIGQCPYTFTFAATFTLNQGATLTYGLEAGSDTPGFQFVLPSPQTSTFGPGTYSLTFPLEFTDSGSGWVRFHVTSPVDVRSNQATFDLTCNP